MDVDFTRLRYFVTVAEELHFKRAADRLLITPPPLSKQIRLLESELGGPLFERSYHDVRLTPLGQALLGPARDILRRVDELKAAAASLTNQVAMVRVGATAYAPSDFLDQFGQVVAGLPQPTSFDVSESAAVVTAKLVSGNLDLGLIILPATDDRISYRVVAEYQGAVAVRSDDPLAARDVIAIEELRDRQVVVDMARPNPVVLAAVTRALAERGVSHIVRVVSGHGGEVEMAAQVYNRRLVALVAYAPASSMGRLFSPPEFRLIPVDEGTWEPAKIALAWSPHRLKQRPWLQQIAADISGKLGPLRHGA
jgi:DNA-binding transcriptional LysR family regulator